MDRLHVRLTTCGVAGLIAIAAVVFGWRAAPRDVAPPVSAGTPARPATVAPSGAGLFERHCGGCHTAGDLARGLRAAPDPAARRAAVMQFLESHGSATADEDRAVLDYLFAGAR
jgi:mono/diheme cytochrome c family protein